MPIKDLQKRREYCKLYRAKNIDRIKAADKAYRESNIESILVKDRKRYHSGDKCKRTELMKIYRIKNIDKIKDKKIKYYNTNRDSIRLKASEDQKYNVSILSDKYIKHRLAILGIPKEPITPELIELERIIIKTKRLCRTLKN